MNDNGKKSSDWKMIIAGIVLIAVLFVGVKFIFWGLEQLIPKRQVDISPGVSISQDISGEPDAPSFCIHCGRALPESFRWGQFCPWCGEKNER